MIDYPAIRTLLERLGYQGFVTVEQERDPRSAGGNLADVKANRDYLRSILASRKRRLVFGRTYLTLLAG